MKPTDYMKLLKEGINTYRSGKYDESDKVWRNLLTLNSNLDLAYSKIGMIEIRRKNYEEAMKYFELALAYDPYLEHRANLDPEMYALVNKYKQLKIN